MPHWAGARFQDNARGAAGSACSGARRFCLLKKRLMPIPTLERALTLSRRQGAEIELSEILVGQIAAPIFDQ
jgi:hypothetical protein